MAHEWMNPYDFVPLPDGVARARTFTLEEFGAERLSGTIHLRMKTLTPLHVAGPIQAPDKGAMRRRCFYQQRDPQGREAPCVPGTSIKGALRAYVEALTNGWFSALQAHYEEEPKKRAMSFTVVARDEQDKEVVLPRGYWVPERLERDDTGHERLDVASFLFGITLAGGSDGDESGARGRRGRVSFSDVYFNGQDLEEATSLDLDSDAAFGEPKPRRNNFWYFTPGHFLVQEKWTPRGTVLRVLSPHGERLRGRKFYFHQDPVRCVRWYKENWRWMKLMEVKTEVVRAGSLSQPFTLRFEGLPARLLQLLLFVLCPPGRTRHKLGALKPFGFGSVELVVNRLELDPVGLGLLDAAPASRDGNEHLEAAREAPPFIEAELLNEQAWAWLRHILHCPEVMGERWLFVYPPYHQAGRDVSEKGFAKVLTTKDLPESVSELLNKKAGKWNVPGVRIGERDPKLVAEIVERLAADATRGKETIDLPTYQRRAQSYQTVCQVAGDPRAVVPRAAQRKQAAGAGAVIEEGLGTLSLNKSDRSLRVSLKSGAVITAHGEKARALYEALSDEIRARLTKNKDVAVMASWRSEGNAREILTLMNPDA